MDFNQSKTKENLARAFAAECQDGARYQFMAQAAMSEGFMFISNALKTLAKNEMAHASTMYRLMLDYCKGKEDNVPIEAGYPFEPSALKQSLHTASEIEEYESKNIYPSFAKVARDEGFPEIANALTLIAEVENTHALRLQALNNLYRANKLYKSSKPVNWECSNCGHQECAKQAWSTCPLCGYAQGYVIIPQNIIENN